MNVLRSTCAAYLTIACMALTACSGGGKDPGAATPGAAASLVADAGPDQSASVGSFVRLNGVKSINSRGAGLTYAWNLKLPPGSQAVLSNPNVVDPTFTVDVGGTYEATLIVSDGSLVSAPDMVLILANGTPAANPGLNMNAFVNRPIVLDGSGSNDAEDDPLRFQWSITSKPERSISQLFDANTVAPSFTPDLPGDYSFQLIVNDGKTSSPPATVSIAASIKPPPTVDVGVPNPFQKFVPLNTETISLNGSASHTNPPGESLTYLWTIQPQGNAPPVSLNLTTPSTATFSPQLNTAGSYVATLMVTEPDHPDSTKNTATQSLTITIGPLARVDIYRESVAAANLLSSCTLSPCAPVSVELGKKVQFDGSGSSVPPLTYQWTISNFDGGATATPSFTPDTLGEHPVVLTVIDGGRNIDTKSVTLKAVQGPSIGAISVTQNGGDVNSVLPGTTALLTTTVSGTTSPDCTWTLDPPIANVTITPGGCNAGNGGVTADIRATVSGTYQAKLTVGDNNNPAFDPAERPVTFIANQAPTVALSAPTSLPNTEAPNTTKNECLSVELTATATSTDNYPDQGYSWEWSGIPGGASFTTPATNQSKARFTVKDTGGYTVKATATETGAPSNLASNFATRTVSFTSAAAGHTLYDTGIPNVTTGACRECHKAGTHDTTVGDPFRSVLATKTLVGKSSETIRAKLNSSTHYGKLFKPDGTRQDPAPTGTIDDTQATNLAAFLATVECLNPGSSH